LIPINAISAAIGFAFRNRGKEAARPGFGLFGGAACLALAIVALICQRTLAEPLTWKRA
jgi:hypothetical protein